MTTPLKSKLFSVALAAGLVLIFAVSDSLAQSRTTRKRARGSVCGNPKLPCRTSATFQPNDLPFRVPANSVIWDTELFYAVILKTVTSTEDNCDVFVSESERLQTQALFPERKVFANRCYDIENLFYTTVDPKFRIMAVYAGSTLAEANRVLESVKITGKFPGAYLRRMRTGFNGT